MNDYDEILRRLRIMLEVERSHPSIGHGAILHHWARSGSAVFLGEEELELLITHYENKRTAE